MKNFYLSLFLLFFLQNISSQNTKIDSSYINYFQNTRELPHLHLNKTSFLQGEEIWFQAYVLEQNSQKLHPTSSNLYVSIFDDSGILKDQQLIALKNGIGNGQIYLDSTYIKENYYVKASTNWMQNFNEDHSFTQKITLVLGEKKLKNKSLSESEFFEFKLFPEGGHIIANATNNIGILLKDSNNKGIKVTQGIIKDEKGETIEEFSTNQLGFGKVPLFFEESQAFIFEALLSNGSAVEIKTPKARVYGVTMSVMNNDSDDIAINILTNKKSLSYLNGKKYRMFIHNTRTYNNFFFEFNSTDEIYKLVFKKEDLPNGMNIITLFNENDKPVLERLIFNNSNQLYANVTLNESKIVSDSLDIKLTNETYEKLFLSASFLPVETQSYSPNHSIVSSFLIRPYISGRVETPDYYFKSTNKFRLDDLDLLLLTQGWSKYKWSDIFNKPPTTNFDFENGIDVTATLNKPLGKKQAVLIYSKDNNIVAQIKPNESPYILKNSFIKKNSTVDFALMSNGNRYEINPALSYSKAKLYDVFNMTKIESNLLNELVVSNFKQLAKDTEVLDEVVIIGNKRTYDNTVYGGMTMLTGVKMENMIITSGETVVDFLRSKMYQVSRSNGRLSIRPRGIGQLANMPTLGNSNGGDEAGSSSGNRGIVFRRPGLKILLDGFDISNNLSILESTYLDTVKEIFYGRIPDRLREEIHIYTLSPSEYLDKYAKYSEVNFPVGFATEKEYYSPKYPSYFNDTYKQYGAIFWQPDIVLSPNSITNLKIPLHLQNQLQIYIEGISESGKLIAKEKTINLE